MQVIDKEVLKQIVFNTKRSLEIMKKLCCAYGLAVAGLLCEVSRMGEVSMIALLLGGWTHASCCINLKT